MDCIMKKIKRAYILLFVCVMTVCFSGCQNQSDVSSEDVENSLFMEWCSRFRASNEPLILIRLLSRCQRLGENNASDSAAVVG